MGICFAPWKTWWRCLGLRRDADAHAQSELMERVSHELRTSLTGIVGYAEYLETNSAEPMMNFTANIIRESGLDLARASSAYFDLQYLKQGQIRKEESRFFLAEVTREVVQKHQAKAAQRDVRLVFSCSGPAIAQVMSSDVDRIKQVLDALIFDALQTVDQWGCVRVDLSVNEASQSLVWTLEASASKSDVLLTELYEKFWGTDNYHFRLQQGPGVELALSKALIQFLGGQAIYKTTADLPSQLVVTFPWGACHSIKETV
jgi:signal transduction histidine kinase